MHTEATGKSHTAEHTTEITCCLCRARTMLLTLRMKKEEYENMMEKLQREVWLPNF